MSQLIVTGTAKVGATVTTNAAGGATIGWCECGDETSWANLIPGSVGKTRFVIPAAVIGQRLRAIAIGNNGGPLGMSNVTAVVSAGGAPPVPQPPGPVIS